MSKTINYDFEITNFVTAKAPYGTNPDTLVDQAMEMLLAQINNNEIEFHCKNTFDNDTGEYEPIPEEWYDRRN